MVFPRLEKDDDKEITIKRVLHIKDFNVPAQLEFILWGKVEHSKDDAKIKLIETDQESGSEIVFVAINEANDDEPCNPR